MRLAVLIIFLLIDLDLVQVKLPKIKRKKQKKIAADKSGADWIADNLKDAKKCGKKYQKMGQWKGMSHPYCMYGKLGKRLKITAEERKEILDVANECRMDPKEGAPAKNMCKLYWDAQLAEYAQNFADACRSWRRKDKNYVLENPQRRHLPSITGVAQSTFYSHGQKAKWTDGITHWFSEKKNFEHGKYPKHRTYSYTNLVRDQSCRMGCGSTLCDTGGKKNIRKDVCVLFREVFFDKRHVPYEKGKPCSGCPDHCVDDSLCDTKGLQCYNNGKIDFKNNKCICGPRWTGKYCETQLCYGDNKVCESYCSSNKLTKFKCCQQMYPSYNCPVMCGYCSKDCKAGGKYFFPAEVVKITDRNGDVVRTTLAGSTLPVKGYTCKPQDFGPFKKNNIFYILGAYSRGEKVGSDKIKKSKGKSRN